jgi:chromosome segregation ATPase
LQHALDAANAEIDETRTDALRLQEERDDAIRATDDVRVELMSELESSRDESFQLESQLDELHRLLEDVRDQAREEVLRLTEELGDVRAELGAKSAEIQRLRARLAHAVPAARPGSLPRRSTV